MYNFLTSTLGRCHRRKGPLGSVDLPKVLVPTDLRTRRGGRSHLNHRTSTFPFPTFSSPLFPSSQASLSKVQWGQTLSGSIIHPSHRRLNPHQHGKALYLERAGLWCNKSRLCCRITIISFPSNEKHSQSFVLCFLQPRGVASSRQRYLTFCFSFSHEGHGHTFNMNVKNWLKSLPCLFSLIDEHKLKGFRAREEEARCCLNWHANNNNKKSSFSNEEKRNLHC